jgi:hypothetical protein
MPRSAVIFTFALMAISYSCSKKQGCIDPNAANYDQNSKKDDGSCLYQLSFYTKEVQHGPIEIFINGSMLGTLNGALSTNPRCGVDTLVSTGYTFTLIANLPTGTYDVRAESYDGSIWEDTYVLPENCVRIMVAGPSGL